MYIYIYIYIYIEREREREALNCVWLIINAHETKEDFVFEQLNCAFPHNKFYARTLSVGLIFLISISISSSPPSLSDKITSVRQINQAMS